MKFQLCSFKREKDSKPEMGLAKVSAFGLYDVEFIVDMEGNKMPEVWKYDFISTPMSYIDTDYTI